MSRSSETKSHAESAPTLAPHRCEMEFALVLVEPGSDAQLEHTIAAVARSAEAYGGTVLQILGALIFIGFSGVIGSGAKSQRQAFVEHVCSSYRVFVRIVHGRASSLVGEFGCESRLAYGAIPDELALMLERLLHLKHGRAVEVLSPAIE